MRIATYVVFAIAYLLMVLAVPVSAEQFEGTVIQLDPLQVRSLQGEVRQFSPPERPKPKMGDLVRVTYSAGTSGVNTVSDIDIRGAKLVGTVLGIAADQSWLVVRIQQPGNLENTANVSLQAGKEFQSLVTAMRPGDGVTATYARKEGINSVWSLDWQSKRLSSGIGWLSLGLAAFTLLIVALVFTKGHPTHLYLGTDNRYSNSKFQTVLWFWVVISAYCAIVVLRFIASGWRYIGGVDIPQNLLILSGISVLTFATAKAITAGKVEQATAKGEDAKPPATAPKPGNLISDDLNRTDLGDFQMLVITILAVLIYAAATVEFLLRLEFRSVITMPDVDATLLAIFGLSQAAYLGKKKVGEAGAGMTPEQAAKAAADAATVVKDEAAKAATAEQTAKTQETEAKNAAASVHGATSKAAAQPGLEKTQGAAKAAREAANLAAAAAKTAEARAADIQKLAATWSKEPAAAASIKSSSDLAQAELAKAKTAATNADTAAKSAEEQAKSANTEASQKS